jgi:O-antigen ligase
MLKMGSRGLVCAMLLLVAPLALRHPQRRAAVQSLLPWILLAGFGMLSSGWSALPALSMAQAGCLGLLVAMAIAAALALDSPQGVSRLLCHTACSLTAVSTVLLLARFALPHLGELARNAAGRGAEGLLHPTTAASTASLGILIFVAGRLGWPWRWARMAFWPGMAVNSFVLALSAARLALALTAALCLLLALVMLPRTRFWTMALAVCTAACTFLAVDPSWISLESPTRALAKYARRGQSSRQVTGLSGRDEIWPLMWESFLESPWIGHGYYVTSAQGKVRVWNDRGNFTAHNLFLQSLTTTGLIGFGLLLWGWSQAAVALRRSRTTGRSRQHLKWLLVVLWLWFLGWGMLNASFLAPFQPEAVVFFLSMGLAARLAIACPLERTVGQTVEAPG